MSGPNLRDRVPVEPLDDARLVDIERAIVSRAGDVAPARPPRRWLGLAAALAATAVAAGVVGWFARAQTLVPAATAELAAAPIAVHTDGSGSVIDIGDAVIATAPQTAFSLTRPDGGVAIELARGTLELEVVKRGPRPPLVVRAGDTAVTVVGTKFSVDYGDGHGSVDVHVREGRVKIAHAQHEVFVAAGEMWNTRSDRVELIANTAPPRSTDAALSSAVASAGSDAPGSAASVGSAAIAIRVGPLPNVLHGRTAAVPTTTPARAGGAAIVATAPHPVASSAGSAAPLALDPAKDPYRELRAQIHQVALAPILAANTGDPNAAAAFYRQRLTGADAAAAEYSLAYVLALKLGRTDDALAALDAYANRFSGGADFASALWLRVRILCLEHTDDGAVTARCRAAAYHYLHQVPDGGTSTHIAELITTTP